MAEHPTDILLKKDAYIQGAVLGYIAFNALLYMILKSGFITTDLVMGLGLVFLFIFRGRIFIGEVRRHIPFKKSVFKCLILDFLTTFLGSVIYPLFYFFKVGTFIWFCILVYNHKISD